MSRFWPHTSYAEDQPFAVPILTTHVLYRAFQCGVVLGPVAGTARYWYLFKFSRTGAPSFSTTLLRWTGLSSIGCAGFMAVSLARRMHGKEHIEWADRSWRLLENKGQVAVDDWSLSGAVAGAVVTAWRRLGWQAVTGGAGMGSLAGVAGYMVWRYGVKAGERGEGAPGKSLQPSDGGKGEI